MSERKADRELCDLIQRVVEDHVSCAPPELVKQLVDIAKSERSVGAPSTPASEGDVRQRRLTFMELAQRRAEQYRADGYQQLADAVWHFADEVTRYERCSRDGDRHDPIVLTRPHVLPAAKGEGKSDGEMRVQQGSQGAGSEPAASHQVSGGQMGAETPASQKSTEKI